MLSNTELNPKEQVKAITLKSGKQLQEKEKLDEEKVAKKKEKETNGESSQLVKEYKLTIPYPAKLKKDHMDE